MEKRNWPEEMVWIRKQDQMMYRLISILSVAAMLLLVGVVAHWATVSGAASAVPVGMSWISEDTAPMAMIRLTVSDVQMAEAVTPVQDALHQRLLEQGEVVLEAFGQDEQQTGQLEQMDMEESEFADPVIAQTGDYDWDTVGVAVCGTVYYDVVKDDNQNVRGQPDILIDSEPPDMMYCSNGDVGWSRVNYAMRSNCVRALS